MAGEDAFVNSERNNAIPNPGTAPMEELIKGHRSSGVSQVGLVAKNLPANAGARRDVGSVPGWGRSPGGGMAAHSSILAWRVLCTEEPGELQSITSQRVGHDRRDSMQTGVQRNTVAGFDVG